MVSSLIFLLHGLAAGYAFMRARKEGVGEGFLAVGFVVIVFAIGWTIATMLTNLVFGIEWFNKWFYQPLDSNFWVFMRKEFNRDSISLILLTLGESGFYYLYFQSEGTTKAGTPPPTPPPVSGV